MDDLDRRLINRLQLGLPLVRHPWEHLARKLDSNSAELLDRLHELLNEGVLTRFGPMFDIDRLGGAFTLAALSVPEARFDSIAELLADMPEVAHNYRREHAWNMWFVLACPSEQAITDTLLRIEQLTDLVPLNLPKEETYHVGLYFPV
ncbi:Lrp/AsnC family transcriptional regulator [Pseudomonas alvandae]|uniref:Lrp/AsnC family transcriptional regulator n=1 Tax=Pseudomonas canavaninivorans TaxID=2842348 RepID=UPI00215E4658|nr:Lrp/AsnC family transcriptional regulator [Pseudomonas canavaninivorans]UVM75163.1 Lrp/AsnC family transcriptional regulator [Pseudomonas canavaninivorans]